MNKLAISLTILASLSTAAAAESKKGAPTPATATYAEIEKALGFVPDFVKQFPQVLLPSWWAGVTTLELNPNTALDGKTKELISLAVASTIPCEYCIYFDTEGARLEGATDEEIQEAIGMAAITRASSAMFNGMQIDKASFKRDVNKFVATARAHMKK